MKFKPYSILTLSIFSVVGIIFFFLLMSVFVAHAEMDLEMETSEEMEMSHEMEMENSEKEHMTINSQACLFTRDLYEGVGGDDVECLQDFLKEKRFFAQSTESTGYFGPITLVAVKNWQKTHNIKPAAGYFGPISKTHYSGISSGSHEKLHAMGDHMEHAEMDLSGIHIMPDGSVMLGSGDMLHSAMATDDGMIKLEDGTMVTPVMDMRQEGSDKVMTMDNMEHDGEMSMGDEGEMSMGHHHDDDDEQTKQSHNDQKSAEEIQREINDLLMQVQMLTEMLQSLLASQQ